MTEAIQITKSEAMRRIDESLAKIALYTGRITAVNEANAEASSGAISVAKPDTPYLPMQG